jgi:hypothetical protein
MTKKSRQPLITSSTIVFILGALLGLWLLITSAWGDLEGRLFDSALSSDETLTSLKCPPLITPSEIGMISATFDNDSDFERNVIIQARMTMGHTFLLTEQRDEFMVAPGESLEMEWEVFPNQVAYGRLILVRIYQFRSFSIPSRSGSCGIMLVNLPQLTGNQIFYGGFAISLVLMVLGVGLRKKLSDAQKSQVSRITNGLIFLGVVIIIGILLTLLGSWLISVLMVVFAVITIIGILSFLG